MLHKSKRNAFWWKWVKSQKYLALFEVGSVLANEQNTGRWSKMSAKQIPDLMIFSGVLCKCGQ